MIVTFIVVGLFVFKAPHLAWLSVPICFIYLVIKSEIKSSADRKRKDKRFPDYDEFDMWMDDQGF